MTYIKLGGVRAFPGAVPDKAQALKVLEEAVELSELFGDGIVPEVATRECALKHGISEQIMDAIE